MRARCSVFIATSLDGYIARLDGGIDWLSLVERAGEDYGFRTFFDSVDTLVLGRRTHEAVLAFDEWPYGAKRVVVLAHEAFEARHGEEPYSGPARPLVEKLGAEGASRIYVDGGVVIRQFLEAGLVDDMTISVLPILLGAGIPLFGGTGPELQLDLVECRSFDSGLVQSTYRARRQRTHAPVSTPRRGA